MPYRAPTHGHHIKRLYDKARGNSAERGYDHRWRKLRRMHLAEFPLCRFCHDAGRVVAANEVDHIDGNAHNCAPSNLRSLCKACHSGRTARDQSGFGNPTKRPPSG
jgi:5-methylcytosine-specific restriction protein A